jgi:hypothetical protein
MRRRKPPIARALKIRNNRTGQQKALKRKGEVALVELVDPEFHYP